MDYGEKVNNNQQRKGRVRQESGPLYEPEDMEETRDAVLDENMQRNILATNTIRNTAGTSGLKSLHATCWPRLVLAQMDATMSQPTPEGEQPVTPADVVAHVLPSSKFLRNVGLEPAAQREVILLLHVYRSSRLKLWQRSKVLQHLEINFMASRMSWKC